LPVMHYEVTQTFALPSVDMPVVDPMPGGLDLCMPDWAPPALLSLQYTGDPIKLLETAEGEYVCCSIECLPTAQEERAPSTAAECTEIPLDLELTGLVPEVDTTAWMDDGCFPPVTGDPGRYTAAGECEMGNCTVLASSGANDPDIDSPSYTAHLISQEGSVFRSQTLQLSVVDGVLELEDVQLAPRVVLRGSVFCDEDLGENCLPGDVAITVERIRQEGEDDPPPPYVYETASLMDGSFTLLVDPGVYVITAIPDRGSAAGPTEYRIVDLRLGDGGIVNFEGGVPVADIGGSPFELAEGVPVVLRLRDFDLGGQVEPIDLGSWVDQATPLTDPDGAAVDLNNPLTCYSLGAADRGCVIRRMIRSDSAGILASISNSADFTMRKPGDITCPSP
jgi:hypothetical protein